MMEYEGFLQSKQDGAPNRARNLAGMRQLLDAPRPADLEKIRSVVEFACGHRPNEPGPNETAPDAYRRMSSAPDHECIWPTICGTVIPGILCGSTSRDTDPYWRPESDWDALVRNLGFYLVGSHTTGWSESDVVELTALLGELWDAEHPTATLDHLLALAVELDRLIAEVETDRLSARVTDPPEHPPPIEDRTRSLVTAQGPPVAPPLALSAEGGHRLT